MLYINKIKIKLKIENEKIIKITGISYNIQSNTFMFILNKHGANLSYPYVGWKRYVLSRTLNTSRDEHSLTSLGSAFHNRSPNLANIWSHAVTKLVIATLKVVLPFLIKILIWQHNKHILLKLWMNDTIIVFTFVLFCYLSLEYRIILSLTTMTDIKWNVQTSEWNTWLASRYCMKISALIWACNSDIINN